jgi:hypothetical protein
VIDIDAYLIYSRIRENGDAFAGYFLMAVRVTS